MKLACVAGGISARVLCAVNRETNKQINKRKKEKEPKQIFVSVFHVIDKLSYTNVLNVFEYVWSTTMFTSNPFPGLDPNHRLQSERI